MQDRYYSAFNLDFGNEGNTLYNLDSVKNTVQVRKDYYTNIDTLLTIYFTGIVDELTKQVFNITQTRVTWKGVDLHGKHIIFTGTSVVPEGSYVQTEHGPVMVTPELVEKVERLFTVTLPVDEVALLKTQEDIERLISKYVTNSNSTEVVPLQDFNYNELTNTQLESLKSNVRILQSSGKLGVKC